MVLGNLDLERILTSLQTCEFSLKRMTSKTVCSNTVCLVIAEISLNMSIIISIEISSFPLLSNTSFSDSPPRTIISA